MAMLTVLFVWGVSWLVLDGAGRLVARAFRIEEPAWLFPWLGFAGVLGLAQAWHLAWPVDGWFRGAIVVAAIAGFVLRRPGLRDLKRKVPELTLLVLAALWLSNQALFEPRNPDTGLYFQQAVRWASDHPATPGIANLNHRLGLNHSYFLFVAAFEHLPGIERGGRVVNGLLVLMALWPVLLATGRVARGEAKRSDLVASFLLTGLSGVLAGYWISSPAADLAVTAFGAVLVLWATPALFGEGEVKLSVATFFCAAGVVMKSSLVVLAAPLWIALAFASRRSVLAVAIPGVVMVLPWMIRGAVLSGWPLFPSTALDLGLAWAVPDWVAQAEAAYVKAWGRLPGRPAEESQGIAWIGQWIAANWLDNRNVLAPAALTVSGLLAAGLVRAREKGAWRLFAVAFAGVVLWMATAPDVRHAGVLPWLLPAGPWVAFGIARLAPTALRWTVLPAVGACLLALSGGVLEWHDPAAFSPWPEQKAELRRLPSGVEVPVPLPGSGCYAPWCAVAESRVASREGAGVRIELRPVAFRYRDPARPQAGFAPDPLLARPYWLDPSDLSTVMEPLP